MQLDATIRRWIVVDRKLGTARGELAAGGRRGDECLCRILGLKVLVHVTEDCEPDFA